MRPRRLLVALLLTMAGAGCGRAKLGPTAPDAAAPDAMAGAAGTGGAPDAGGSGEVSDATAGDAEGGPETAAETPLAAAMRALATFAADRDQAQRTRFVDCFGASAEVVGSWHFANDPTYLAENVRLGLIVIDPAQLAACLETARTATCADVAAGAIEAACDHTLTGTVREGGFCLANEDCAGPGDHHCESMPGKCSSQCVPGRVSGGLGVEGRPCRAADGCADGLYCRWNGPRVLEGVCRARVAGGACDGNWSCPFPYACLFDAAGAGTCGVGRAVGAPCHLYGFDADNGPYDECAISLECYPDANGDFRCGPGVDVGDVCGDLPPPVANQNGGFIPCRAGAFCDPDAGSPRHCVPYRAEGVACTAYYQCAEGLDCLQGTCHKPPAGQPVGAPCDGSLDAMKLCAPGSYCAVDEGAATLTPVGVCKAFAADSQPCEHLYECGATSTCVAGHCASCL